MFDNTTALRASRWSRLLDEAQDVLLEIDWQGAQQIRARDAGMSSIFVLPPSREALEQRLRGRGTDPDEVIARRLRDSLADLSHWSEFDYVVVNDDFDRATSGPGSDRDRLGRHLQRDRAVAGTAREAPRLAK